MGRPRKEPEEVFPKSRPARTPEEQENHMISLAMDLAERQLLDGTAASPLINRWLNLADGKYQREIEKLTLENELLRARTSQITSENDREENAKEALAAFREYAGQVEMGD